METSTAEKLYDIVREKGATIPLYVQGIQSEPHHTGILHSNFHYENSSCFLTLNSYIGSHSINVIITVFDGKESYKETLYVDDMNREPKSENLQKILNHFIELMNDNKMFRLYN